MEKFNQKEKTLEQLKEVNVSEIKSLLKKLVPDKFEKMIINNSQSFERANYQFVKYKNITGERMAKKMEFPLFPDIQNDFSQIEGGLNKFEPKTILVNDLILTKLKSHKIEPKSLIDRELPENWFVFPYTLNDYEINVKQPNYFFPDKTFQETCTNCKGDSYVTCKEKDCLGKHEWVCPRCNGARRVTCDTCKAKGYWKCESCNGKGENKCQFCGGQGEVRCRSCGGDGVIEGEVEGKAAGWVMDRVIGSNLGVGSDERCSSCGGKGYHRCSACRDGFIKCAKCTGKGEIRCDKCSGKGEIFCPDCEASGKIICKKCYGDTQRYGKIDCPVCKAVGVNAYLQYVETIIKDNIREKVYNDNPKFMQIQDEQIIKHCSKNFALEMAYFNANSLIENYDDFSQKFCTQMQSDFQFNKKSFPIILKEEIYYETIPCIRISYKHMLTNTIHEITIVNFFKNPELIFHSEPEDIKKDIKNTLKVAGGLFGKLFKTKTHLTKEDNKTKIRLLIYMAKSDGKIEDEEKEKLSSLIGSFDDFTNAEKKEFFDLMNSKTLPELTNKDVKFSCQANADETFKELENMAMADGTFEESEKVIMEKMKSLIMIKK